MTLRWQLLAIGLVCAFSDPHDAKHAGGVAVDKKEPGQDNFDQYMSSYLPAGDDSYTKSFVGDNASWRNYETSYAGKSADYSAYLSKYGGKQANYGKYVSLYSSMAGSQPTSGKDYKGKGKEQLSAWNKTMTKTYDKYIPGAYESFAKESTEVRGQGGGQQQGGGTGGGSQQGSGSSQGGGSSQGSGGGNHGSGGSSQGSGGGQGQGEGGGQESDKKVGYEAFAGHWVQEYATAEGASNAFDYEGKEFASNGMGMGGSAGYADYMNQYAPGFTTEDGGGMMGSAKQPSEDIAVGADDEDLLRKPTELEEAPHEDASEDQVLEHFQRTAAAVEQVEAEAAKLGAAARDQAYADWAASRHRPAAKVEGEAAETVVPRQILRDAMAGLQGDATKQQNAEKSASSAMDWLLQAETDQVRSQGVAAHKGSIQAARRWSADVEREAAAARASAEALLLLPGLAPPQAAAGAALLRRSEAAWEEAHEAGLRLEQSLDDAASRATQTATKEILIRADERRAAFANAVETAAAKAKAAAAQEAQEAQEETAQSLGAEEGRRSAQGLRGPRSTGHGRDNSAGNAAYLGLQAEQLKAVSGNFLLWLTCVAGVVGTAAGIMSRLGGLAGRTSRSANLHEVALLEVM